jgi:hypothetical protein
MRSRKLEPILKHHVAKLHFIKKGDKSERTMICTKSKKLLNTYPELGYLHSHLDIYKPRTDYYYNPNSHENVVVWDIQCKDVRQIWARTCLLDELIHENDFKGLI